MIAEGEVIAVFRLCKQCGKAKPIADFRYVRNHRCRVCDNQAIPTSPEGTGRATTRGIALTDKGRAAIRDAA